MNRRAKNPSIQQTELYDKITRIQTKIIDKISAIKKQKPKCDCKHFETLAQSCESYDPSIDYYQKFWKGFLLNQMGYARLQDARLKIDELSQRISEIDDLFDHHDQLLGGRGVKRNRRQAHQVDKIWECPYQPCFKSYGSQISLNLHMKLKHNGGNKSQRDRAAVIQKLFSSLFGKHETITDLCLPSLSTYLQDLQKNMEKHEKITKIMVIQIYIYLIDLDNFRTDLQMKVSNIYIIFMKNIFLEVDCANITIDLTQNQILIKINAKLKSSILNNSQHANIRVLHRELIADLQMKYCQLFKSKIIKQAPPVVLPVVAQTMPNNVNKEVPSTEQPQIAPNIFSRRYRPENSLINQQINTKDSPNNTSNNSFFRKNLFNTSPNQQQSSTDRIFQTNTIHQNTNLSNSSNNCFLMGSSNQQPGPTIFSQIGRSNQNSSNNRKKQQQQKARKIF